MSIRTSATPSAGSPLTVQKHFEVASQADADKPDAAERVDDLILGMTCGRQRDVVAFTCERADGGQGARLNRADLLGLVDVPRERVAG